MKTSAKSGWLRLVLAFGAGALLGVSFPKLDLYWIAWLAPGLILGAARQPTGKEIFRAGYAAGLGHYGISLYWLLLIPFPWHGLAGYLSLCGLLSFFLATWCWVCWRAWPQLGPRRHVIWPCFCAAAWVAMEMLIARVLTGFPWNLLGASQLKFTALIQIAAFTGVYGVSFLIVWLSVSLANGVWLMRNDGKFIQAAAMQLPPMIFIAGVVAFGAHRLSQPEVNRGQLKIALVQPAIPQYAVWDPLEKTNRFLKLMDLTRTALQSKPDLVAWPEAAMPDIFTRNSYLQSAIISLMEKQPVWLVMGAADTAKRGAANTGDEDHFNSAFLINPHGELVDRYYKRHLVPFGEYMPGAQHLLFLAKLRAAGVGTTPGQRAASFQIGEPKAKFPVLICFEDMFPQEVRQRVGEDSDFMLNLTSDAWFGESAAQWQHAEGAAFRAVENGVPLVRCCNNGLTCWIDARGRMHDVYFQGSDSIYMAGYKIVEVQLRASAGNGQRTFYNRHGDWFGWSCSALVLAAGSGFWMQRRRGKTGHL